MKRSLVALGVLMLCVLGIWEVLGRGTLPVEYRSVSVWVPKDAVVVNMEAISLVPPALPISLQEYQENAQEFTQHVVIVMPGDSVFYLGSRGGILFQTHVETPKDPNPPQGFQYRFLARTIGSRDPVAGTITYAYNPQVPVTIIVTVLGSIGVIAAILLAYWTSRRLFRKKK